MMKEKLLNKLVHRMVRETVRFKYAKVDGTIREANGTLKEDMLPPTKGTIRNTSDSVQVYYDTDKQSWRSFKKENLIEIL